MAPLPVAPGHVHGLLHGQPQHLPHVSLEAPQPPRAGEAPEAAVADVLQVHRRRAPHAVAVGQLGGVLADADADEADGRVGEEVPDEGRTRRAPATWSSCRMRQLSPAQSWRMATVGATAGQRWSQGFHSQSRPTRRPRRRAGGGGRGADAAHPLVGRRGVAGDRRVDRRGAEADGAAAVDILEKKRRRSIDRSIKEVGCVMLWR